MINGDKINNYEYQLEKKIWTEADFDKMGWHDCSVYKMHLNEDLELDVDYILKWNKPEVKGLPCTFWIAPATLVFHNVSSLKFELSSCFEAGFEIAEIKRTNADYNNVWTITGDQDELIFNSSGYTQYFRQEPSFQFGQFIPFVERYSYSLERIIDQKNPALLDESVIRQRRKNFEHFENAQKRELQRLESEQLEIERNNNIIGVKEYFLRKKKITEKIKLYDLLLKDTLFEKW